MGFVKKIAKFLISPLGAVAGLFDKPKRPALPKPVTRDDAAEKVARDDELLRRRGAAADLINGVQGAEASSSSLGRLVVGS